MNADDIKINTLRSKAQKILERTSRMGDLVQQGKLSMDQMKRDLGKEIQNMEAMINEDDQDFWFKNANPTHSNNPKSLVVARKRFSPFKEVKNEH